MNKENYILSVFILIAYTWLSMIFLDISAKIIMIDTVYYKVKCNKYYYLKEKDEYILKQQQSTLNGKVALWLFEARVKINACDDY